MPLPVQAANYPSRGFSLGVPNNTTVLPVNTRGFLVLSAGNLVVDNHSDVTVTIPVSLGMIVPIAAKRLKTGSTASVLILA